MLIFVSIVGRGSDRQDVSDRLDSQGQLMLIDELDHYLCG